MGRKCKFWLECRQDAVYRIPHSHLALCKDHFLQNVEKRVKDLIEKKHLFHAGRNHKVLIALSGGKDSQVLLHIIKKIFPENDPIVEGLYIELGIAHQSYSKDSGQIARETCEKLNVPFHVIDIKKEYGFDIDNIDWLRQTFEEKKWSLGNGHFRGACSYCGMFKRYTINKYALDNGFTQVATGHNLTDEATALTNNFFNMDLMFLRRAGPINDSSNEKLIPRVKPLYYISEEEIIMYAFYAKIPHLGTECLYSIQAPNLELKHILQEIETYRRGNMLTLLRGFRKKVRPLLIAKEMEEENEGKLCQICGMPTYSKKCYFCRTMNFLSSRFKIAQKKLHPAEEQM